MSTKILFIFLITILVITSISAQANVQCARDADCGNGEVCQKIGNPTDWYCIKTSGEATQTIVSCATHSDCNRDMVCDTLTHTCKGGTTNPTCGDNDLQSVEECDDGNTKGGDGCSSTCQLEYKINETNYTPVITASIIGVCIVIGFIIFAIIIKRRK